MANILFVDDDFGVISTLGALIKGNGHSICRASDADEALNIFKKDNFDIVLSDLKMPGRDGIGLLKDIRRMDPHVGFIILTGYPSTDSAVMSIKLLADDYLEKPILDFDNFNRLIGLLTLKVTKRRWSSKKNKTRQELVSPKEADKNLNYTTKRSGKNSNIHQGTLFNELDNLRGFMGFIGNSPRMKEVYRMIEKIAPTDATILIKGDTGTGKEMTARTIHQISNRRDEPFIVVHCGSIPETLLASELFGYEKGAFTGANKMRIGLFEAAHGGTVFLDEIGDIPLSMQLKLLRVLQEKEITKLGSSKVKKVDVRIIAASNKDLPGEVRQKTFREDLYYRLDVLSINLPRLSHRGKDIRLLIDLFISKLSIKYHKEKLTYSANAMQEAFKYPWPGNVRELLSVVERAVIIGDSDVITRFPINIQTENNGIVDKEILKGYGFKEAKQYKIEQFEKKYIAEKVKIFSGNVKAAANDMGVDVKTVWRKIRQYGLNIKKD